MGWGHGSSGGVPALSKWEALSSNPATKRNELLIHATIWMNFEHVLSEINKTRRDKSV
jgi:hypothetical protein